MRHLGVSDPTLCKRFRDALGTTPKQVHDRCRIDRAIDLLNDSHLPIAAIAKRCGFSTPTAFGVAFKRRRGCTPSQWREALG